MTTSAIFGSSIGGLGGSLASENTRFGTLPVVRQFVSGMPGALTSGLTSSQVMFYSFKCNATDYTGMAAGTYDAAITTAMRAWGAGTVYACYYHEPENDGFTLAQWRAAAGHFNNLVHTMTGLTATVIPTQIYMTGTVLGWNGRNINNYWDNTWDANHKPGHLGFDFDGPIDKPTDAAYPDMSTWVTKVQTFAASKGVPWSVTEFGADPLNNDSTHAARAAWNTKSANQFSGGGAQYVMYWDDGGPFLSQTNEINDWKALVQSSPSTTPSPPTGITVTPASDGKTAVGGWATLPGGIDHLDAYLQGPGQTYPHKLNTGGPIPVSPRTYSFPTVPGTTYDPGFFLVAAADAAGTVRSGFSSPGVVVQAPNPGPGTNNPIITSVLPAQDSTNPQLYHLTAAATSPVGASLLYSWTFTFPSDQNVPAVTLPSASGDVTLPATGQWSYTLTVTDSAGRVTPATGTVTTVPVGTSNYTAFVNARMLGHGETVLDAANVDQDAGPKFDAAIQLLYFRKSAHNAKYGLAGSAFNPDDIDPTATLQIAAGNIYWGAFILEDIQLTQLLFASLTTAQSGTGVLVSVHDSTGAMVPEFGGAGVSADSVFQGAAGNLTLPLGLQVKRDNWGDLLFWQKFVPGSGVTAAALRVGTGPSSIGAAGLVQLFATKTASGLQNPLPFGSGTAAKQIWVGAR